MYRRILTATVLVLVSVLTMAQSKVKRETCVYSIKGSDTLKIDAYLNSLIEPEQTGRPTLIYIHGGGFVTGSRINAAQETFCRYLAERGWLALSVDYRLAGISQNEDGSLRNPYHVSGTLEAIRLACEDIVDATGFVINRKDWKADSSKICLGGGSAGAITSLQVVYDACNREEYTQKLPKGFAYAGIVSQAGCIGSSTDTLTWKTQPCPIMFFHGSEDIVVPLEKIKADWADCHLMGTEYIARQLKQKGVPYWKFIEKGADHVMAMKPLTTYLEEQYRFLSEVVLKGTGSTVETIWQDKEPAGMASVEMMLKHVPLYIMGFGKYLDELETIPAEKPKEIVY